MRVLVHRGNVLLAVLVLSVVGGLLAISVPSLRGAARTLPTSAQVADLIVRVGLDAESLAAAGCTSTQTTAAIEAAREHVEANYDAVVSTEQTFAQRSGELGSLTDMVQRGLANEAQVAFLSGVQSSTPTALAITNLQANLAPVRTVWEEAVGGTGWGVSLRGTNGRAFSATPRRALLV